MTRWPTRALLTAALWTALGSGATAQPVGRDATGLPGIVRVGLPVEAPASFTAAGTVGYGLTESQFDDEGSHHRGAGVLGLGVRPTDWLGLALVLDGRYDFHPEDETGETDEGGVGTPGLLARAGSRFGPLALGGEVVLRVPGEDVPSFVPGALVLDLAALVGYAPADSPFALATKVGYRLDNSAGAIDRPEQLRRGDRLALGLSDFDALLIGAGVTYRTGNIEVLLEASWDVLLGARAPGASESPMRLGAGARVHLSAAAQLLMLVEGNPGSRPDVPDPGETGPLIPVEPRFGAWVGLRYTVPFADEASPVEGTGTGAWAGDADTATLRGRILDARGNPVAGARVEVRVGERTFEAVTDGQGNYVIEGVPAGPARLRVQAEGFDATETELTVGPDAQAPEVVLEPSVRSGQLRGLVRNFSGRTLAATVTVEPLGTQVQTDADGLFEIDVPPGEYELVIEARGYETQRRRVEVQENGVTVLNADMRRSSP